MLELADDPNKVDVILEKRTRYSISAFVYEKRDEPVTNKVDYEKYLSRISELRKESQENPKNPFEIFLHPEPPPEIDKFHALRSTQVYEGLIDLHDYIFYEIHLFRAGPHVIHVSIYEDKPSLQRKGMAKDFYFNLRNKIKLLGFRFITGSNNYGNVEFFTSKLGRFTLDKIKPYLRAELTPSLRRVAFKDIFTIDFLYPEDKEEYLIGDNI